jgi:hypothetical protein
MNCIDSPYWAYRELFVRYPQAVRAVNRSGTALSMVVMLQEGDQAGFFVLSQDSSHDEPSYLFWSWPASDIVDIRIEDSHSVPDVVKDVAGHGVPIPRDGSLFGWVIGGAVTALIAIYVESAPDLAEPAWAVMPLASTPEAQWPPFTGERLFRHWSWKECRTGRLISLDRVIAINPGTAWWVNTKESLGSNCCAIAHDVTTPQGNVLRRGCYVYYQVLQEDQPIPALKALLSDPDKIDLAPRFRGAGRIRPATAEHAPAFSYVQEYCGD